LPISYWISPILSFKSFIHTQCSPQCFRLIVASYDLCVAFLDAMSKELSKVHFVHDNLLTKWFYLSRALPFIHGV
jgi:hypothetical protein